MRKREMQRQINAANASRANWRLVAGLRLTEIEDWMRRWRKSQAECRRLTRERDDAQRARDTVTAQAKRLLEQQPQMLQGNALLNARVTSLTAERDALAAKVARVERGLADWEQWAERNRLRGKSSPGRLLYNTLTAALAGDS